MEAPGMNVEKYISALVGRQRSGKSARCRRHAFPAFPSEK